MIKHLKRSLRDMAFGSVITAAVLSYVAAPHLEWTLHAGNQLDLLAHTKEMAVAESQLPAQPVAPKAKAKQ